jgi:FkbM family methyltransferase
MQKMISRLKDEILAYAINHLGMPTREHISKTYIARFVQERPIIVDCGAHDGHDSVELCNQIDATVHAFEPVPALFARLKERTRAYPNIHCYELALGDTNGTIEFFVSSGGSEASSSILAPKEHLRDHPNVRFERKIRVQSMTLDSWAERNNIERIDFLWLDMQGFEMQMLQASPRIVSMVQAIHTEVSTRQTYSGVRTYPEFRTWLNSQGFSVAVEAIPDDWDMGNVLFVRGRGRPLVRSLLLPPLVFCAASWRWI